MAENLKTLKDNEKLLPSSYHRQRRGERSNEPIVWPTVKTWKNTAVAMLLVLTFLVYHSYPLLQFRFIGDSGEIKTNLQRVLSQLTRLRQEHISLIAKLKKSSLFSKFTNDSSVPFHFKSSNLLVVRVPSEQYEKYRRSIYSNTKELWYYIRHQLRNFGNLSLEQRQDVLEEIALRKRSLLSYHEQLSKWDGFEGWRREEARRVARLVQRRLRRLQHPPDCRRAKKLVCCHDNCGFGCDHHHLVYCLTFAYATGRTLILPPKTWKYARNWTSVFHDLSESCTSTYNDTRWAFNGSRSYEHKVLTLKKYGFTKREWLDVLPSYIPDDLGLRVARFNGDPTSWWVGQLLHYVQRPRNHVQLINVNVTKDNFTTPIVGVHVRRTDKLIREAKRYELAEYMRHVEEYYAQVEMTMTHTAVVRRVYLATDDASVFKEAVLKYPQYVFYGSHSNRGAVDRRYRPQGLDALLVDLYTLARCDYVVFTFSSNIGRLVYEMMQANRLDASNSVYSLDSDYYFNIHEPWYRLAVMRNVGTPRGIDFKVGDIITGNNYSRAHIGTVLETNLTGPIPWYKTVEHLIMYRSPYTKVPEEPEP